VRQERHYRLITPLFGGGVEPGVADPVTIIRGTAIRGQLRFWWRATRGGYTGADVALLEDKDLLDHMKRREAEIWGAASLPDHPGVSQVQIEVRITATGDDFIVRDQNRRPMTDRDGNALNVGAPMSPYGYGGFPLNSRPDAKVKEGIRFALVLTFPDTCRSDVEASLWAWETFGGIGGRTRRGFGALTLDTGTETHADQQQTTLSVDRSDATRQAVEGWVAGNLQRHVIDGRWPNNVPHLSRQLSFMPTRLSNTADETWRYLLKQLKDFRQQRATIQRNSRRKRTDGTWDERMVPVPGRNRWPEPDVIRALTKKSANYTDFSGNQHDHTRPVCEVNGQPVMKFPRAAFGLPIIFKFKDEDARNGDPPDQYSLTAKHPDQDDGYERLASPLILRPLECRDSKAIGLAVVLDGTCLPNQIFLVSGSHAIATIAVDLTQSEALQIKNEQNRPLLQSAAAGQLPAHTLRDFLNRLK